MLTEHFTGVMQKKEMMGKDLGHMMYLAVVQWYFVDYKVSITGEPYAFPDVTGLNKHTCNIKRYLCPLIPQPCSDLKE